MDAINENGLTRREYVSNVLHCLSGNGSGIGSTIVIATDTAVGHTASHLLI